jgi:pimeloyl-ACP methyl ester carboxylesterase
VSGAEAYAWRALVADVRGVAEALCAETGHSRVALGVGHSFGGTLIMAAEAERPGLFARIVAIDPVIPAPLGEGATVAPPRANVLAERALRRRHVWPSREAARAHFAERELFRAFTPRALDLYVAEGLRTRPDGQVELKCSPEAESGVFSGAGGFDVFSLLGGLRAPVLMLWARRGSFPRALYEQLVASMQAARIEDVDTGHLVPMEDPQVVLDAIERFVAER